MGKRGSILIVHSLRLHLSVEAFRSNKSAFYKNREDHSPPPARLQGEEVSERVSSLPKASDHQGKVSGYGESHNWSRRNIFWDLPYWNKLLIRQNLDVMHIEKNVLIYFPTGPRV